MRAALIYQRATHEAAERTGDGITDQVERLRAPGNTDGGDPDDGVAGALVPTG